MKFEDILTDDLKIHLMKMQEDMYLLGKKDCIKSLLEAANKEPVAFSNYNNIVGLLKSILADIK